MEENFKIKVPGQLTGEAELIHYKAEGNGGERNKPAVIICPGGGYWQLVHREEEPVARKFAKMGYESFVLRYSVLPNGFPVSLLELASSVSMVREHGNQWNIDSDRIIVCGFSAGGHLACSLGVFWDKEFIWKTINREKEMIRPDGMILGYPVITSGEYAHKKFTERLFAYKGGFSEEEKNLVSLEKQVSKATPKAFIWQTCTDGDVPVENSVLLTKALLAHHVNVELHIFPDGQHGLSLATDETSEGDSEFENEHCSTWIHLVEKWIKKL